MPPTSNPSDTPKTDNIIGTANIVGSLLSTITYGAFVVLLLETPLCLHTAFRCSFDPLFVPLAPIFRRKPLDQAVKTNNSSTTLAFAGIRRPLVSPCHNRPVSPDMAQPQSVYGAPRLSRSKRRWSIRVHDGGLRQSRKSSTCGGVRRISTTPDGVSLVLTSLRQIHCSELGFRRDAGRSSSSFTPGMQS